MLKMSSKVSDVFPGVLKLSSEVSECKPLQGGRSGHGGLGSLHRGSFTDARDAGCRGDRGVARHVRLARVVRQRC